MNIEHDGSLDQLFTIIASCLEGHCRPAQIQRSLVHKEGSSDNSMNPACAPGNLAYEMQADLFDFKTMPKERPEESRPILENPALREKGRELARLLKHSAPVAYSDILHAWMSELPIARELVSFSCAILKAGISGKSFNLAALERTRTDRSRKEHETVHSAAGKTRREYHRLLGLLRFKPSSEGPLVARCAPDHFVLPLFSKHFKLRFTSSSWAIMDEKRNLILLAIPPELPYVAQYDNNKAPFPPQEGLLPDEIEALWRGYHKALCIESRINPKLQRSLMPVRYWKYLTEL